MKFNDFIKQYRMKYFKTLDKFVKILGVEKTMWRKIERGINPPPRKTLLKKFANIVYMLGYEEAQMYQLAKRWEPSEYTNSANHTLINSNSTPEWREAAIKENTPDYENKYW